MESFGSSGLPLLVPQLQIDPINEFIQLSFSAWGEKPNSLQSFLPRLVMFEFRMHGGKRLVSLWAREISTMKYDFPNFKEMA